MCGKVFPFLYGIVWNCFDYFGVWESVSILVWNYFDYFGMWESVSILVWD